MYYLRERLQILGLSTSLQAAFWTETEQQFCVDVPADSGEVSGTETNSIIALEEIQLRYPLGYPLGHPSIFYFDIIYIYIYSIF